MATKNGAPVVDKDKETLMEVRGIIDGIVESGSKEYSSALKQIARLVSGEKDSIIKQVQAHDSMLTFIQG
jgi:hypothetical protein